MMSRHGSPRLTWTIVVPVCLAFVARGSSAEEGQVQRIVFEQQRIEGKIRRPQLVLIKADQRPEFTPMVMQGPGEATDIAEQVDRSVLESSPYEGPFVLEGKRVRGLVP